MTVAPCHCGCAAPHPAHAVARALARGDLGAALDAGLLDVPPCPSCSHACRATLRAARDDRLVAFAARERHRARADRLARRQQERDARRAAARMPTADDTARPAPTAPSLPPAAAAALARAKARAAGRTPR
ncbi:MAG TPA: hypothetical protein VM576_03230 [Xanthomonadaceae bacterium]|nr:hypothetical protein [Xanthomonadaceae bacterium]